MKKKEKLILMFKDFEVLTFTVSFNKERVKFVEKLEHFDKAPYEFHKENADYDMALLKFFNKRSIPPQRYNFD